jgi:hypothetical protein
MPSVCRSIHQKIVKENDTSIGLTINGSIPVNLALAMKINQTIEGGLQDWPDLCLLKLAA